MKLDTMMSTELLDKKTPSVDLTDDRLDRLCRHEILTQAHRKLAMMEGLQPGEWRSDAYVVDDGKTIVAVGYWVNEDGDVLTGARILLLDGNRVMPELIEHQRAEMAAGKWVIPRELWSMALARSQGKK